jgi:hypothetical protein
MPHNIIYQQRANWRRTPLCVAEGVFDDLAGCRQSHRPVLPLSQILSNHEAFGTFAIRQALKVHVTP